MSTAAVSLAPGMALALEPRFMFDGAAVATAAHVINQPADSLAQGEHPPSQVDAGHGREQHDVGPFGSKAEAQFAAAAAAAADRQEIVFVDARLPGIDRLAAAPGVEIVVVDAEADGIAQVTATLAGRQGIDAIHFVGHGVEGQFSLGATTVDASLLAARPAEIAGWSAALDAGADLMIWGCDVGSTAAGHALMETLGQITGADVAASIDGTGAEQLGGNWRLEVSTGSVEAAQPFSMESLASWEHLLAAPALSGINDLEVSEPSALNPVLGASSSVGLGASGWRIGYSQADEADNVRVTIGAVDAGFGAFSAAVAGGVKAADGSWTFLGTMAQADSWLRGMTFTAADVERGNADVTLRTAIRVENLTDGGTATRNLTLHVVAANDPTVLPDASLTVDEVAADGRPSVTVIDSSVFRPVDPEVAIGAQTSEQIVYTLKANASEGYLTLGGVRLGVGSVFTQRDVEQGLLAYVHTSTGAAQNTTDRFVVVGNDGATPMSASPDTTITLNIRPVNQAPSVSGEGQVYEGQPANAVSPGAAPSIVGNFIVADGGGDPGDAQLNVTITSLPAHGLLYYDGRPVEVGFTFAYADRALLTYAHDGVDDPALLRPAATDSFGVEVVDGGGGAGEAARLSAASTIRLTVLAANDDPVWNEGSTLQASVDPSYRVTLTTDMLDVADVDTADNALSFVLAAQALDQGRLILSRPGADPLVLPVGAAFTLADVKAGHVQYVQYSGAQPGDTDSFRFYVVDGGVTLGWTPDGAHFERVGGVQANPADPDSALRLFDFTINLLPTETGEGGGMPEFGSLQPAKSTSNYAGSAPDGVAVGELLEGGTITLYDGRPQGGVPRPGLSYDVPGVPADQVIYTILGLDGAGEAWNGKLELFQDGAWVELHVYDRFTQADLNAGLIRFVHDGSEDFESSVRLNASAGLLVGDGQGGLVPDEWETDFTFYVTPVNDAPSVTGSTGNVLDEGGRKPITTDILGIADPDDAASEAWLEGAATLAGGGPNYALNHAADAPLTFRVTALPANGVLQWNDGGVWRDVTADTVLQASWLTGDPATTGLRYSHGGGESLADSFGVVATDRNGADSAVATVSLVITPVNDAPDIARTPLETDPVGIRPGAGAGTAVNNPLDIVKEGAWERITADFLQAVDPDSSAAQVQYSITSAPAHGRLAYSTDNGTTFTPLGVGSSFSQADIDAGHIYYQHRGDEPSGRVYPQVAPDDRFVFTLSDGASEVTGREFWIYVRPSNDAPVVTAPAGPVNSTDTQVSVPGFTVSDPDLSDGVLATEVDFLQVTVRLLGPDGTPLAQSGYAGVGITAGAVAGVTVDAARNGSGGILVLRGSASDINAALALLQVSFSDDRDNVYRVEVIADDRVRDAGTGALVDRDAVLAGVNVGGNGGGTFNQSSEPYTKDATPVSAYDGFDWYADAVPADDAAILAGYPVELRGEIVALIGNISSASMLLRASTVNDPAVLTGTSSVTVNEDQYTPIGGQIGFEIADADSDSFGTPVTVTLSVPAGSLRVSAAPEGLTVSGNQTGVLTITGTASAIQDFLNASLAYRSAADANHDQNDAQPGDVTLTVSLDDRGSNIGSNGTSVNPADLAVAISVTPLNDAPTVSAGSGVLVVVGKTAVGGVTVADRDILGDIASNAAGASDIAGGEADFVQVTVRLRNAAGVLGEAAHSVVTFSSSSTVVAGADFAIDGSHDGQGSALVIRGTLAQVRAWLAGLEVTFSSDVANGDNNLLIDVIADDRLRDLGTGALVASPLANGGLNPSGTTGAVAPPVTAVDPYAAVPAGLTQNVAVASRTILITLYNNPSHIDVVHAPVTEGSGTVRLQGISVSDADALATDVLEATVTIGGGLAISSATGIGSTTTRVGTDTVVIRGTLAQINAVANSIVVQLPDAPGIAATSDWNGSFKVQIRVNDLGNNGLRPDTLVGDSDNPASNPGDFAYVDPAPVDPGAGNASHLLTTREFDFIVRPVNDAPRAIPVDGSLTRSLAGVEDTGAATSSRTVSDLFADYFDDARDAIPGGASSDGFIGVAVVSLSANAAQGEWQYNAGGVWTAIGPRTEATALFLGGDTQLRFLPAADFHGQPQALAVRLVENDAGADAAGAAAPVTGAVVNLSAAGAVGGESRYSAERVTLTTTVANENDRPTLGSATLAGVAEDTTAPAGATVSGLFGGRYGDARDDQRGVAGGGNASTPLGGVAIVGNAASAAEGVWQYSADGTVWTDVPRDVGDSNALLLAPDAKLRFVPAPDYNGVPGGLSVRASDVAVATATGADLTGNLGQTSTWSQAAALDTVVTPLNDAPTLAGTPLNPTAMENTQTGTGVSIPATPLFVTGSVSVADIDLVTTPGLAGGVFGAGQIEISLGATYLAGDRLSLALPGLPAGVTIDATHDGSGGMLLIHLGAGTTSSQVQALIEALSYSSSSDNPTDFGTKGTRSYTLVLRDGNNLDAQGDTAGGPASLPSAQLAGVITIAASDDPPVAEDNANSVAEGSPGATGNVILDAARAARSTGIRIRPWRTCPLQALLSAARTAASAALSRAPTVR